MKLKVISNHSPPGFLRVRVLRRTPAECVERPLLRKYQYLAEPFAPRCIHPPVMGNGCSVGPGAGDRAIN